MLACVGMCECNCMPFTDSPEDTNTKTEELDRLHTAMKEKLVTTSNAEKLQILTLVPDSWSQNYCSEYCGVWEYLLQSAR